MGGTGRLWHPKWWSRYCFGTLASMQIWNFLAEQQYGITRNRDPDIQWRWWMQMQQKKRDGLIDPDIPGYMLCKYRNEPEQRWMEQRREEFEEALAKLPEEEEEE
mmetsp:Transcript_24550/g.57039  ORF Transcript_24550/g.57039 Transcript_24550/m.57039 type:complete len:105 (+) Transcript_24550:87-401(+)